MIHCERTPVRLDQRVDRRSASNFVLRVEVETAAVSRDLPAGHAVAQHRAEQVQAAVHAHVRVAAVPVERGLDFVARRRHPVARVEAMQDAPCLTLARVDDVPLASVACAKHARIAGLAAAERIEHRAVEYHAVRQHFGDACRAASQVRILLK